MDSDLKPPAVSVAVPVNAPVKRITPDGLRALGQRLDQLFRQYVSDRRIAELRWTKNMRQYLGVYDTEVERMLAPDKSRAYPRITRVKCVSVLARIMSLMFPGNERNWELKASPSADMSPQDVQVALQQAMQQDQEAGVQPVMNTDYVMRAVQQLADDRAKQLSLLVDDQLQELGGDQTMDYIALTRAVVRSGILYGLGILNGPFARPAPTTEWQIDPQTRQPNPVQTIGYKPQFEFIPVWDFYPDMAAKTFANMDGYFIRKVMSRSQVRGLADRADFFGDVIKKYLRDQNTGNYKAQPFESELRSMGVKANVNEQKAESAKYEVLVWNGPINGRMLSEVGVEVADDKMADDLDAEIWMLDGHPIKATLNPWKMLGTDVRTIHTFLFDEDDTSPVGQGLPNIVRDSQMSVCAAARMMLDNASVVCGPNLEVNLDLLAEGLEQDLTSFAAYKIWYRSSSNPGDAASPAVKSVSFDSHLAELMQIVNLYMQFADMETFVGPATGGDMSKGPSEPFRTAAGASMLRGDAALPFKDVIRSFDSFTQSVIQSLVSFNRKFNPSKAMAGDYNVIARGATSLIAKEIRGVQIDQLAATLRPEEMMHLDERKLIEARCAVRDLEGMLVSPQEAARRQKAQSDQQAQTQAAQQELNQANVRKLLADAFKNIAQGQKNQANADAVAVDAALKILEQGLQHAGQEQKGSRGEDTAGVQGDTGGGGNREPSGELAGGGPGFAALVPPGGGLPAAGIGPGLQQSPQDFA